MVEFWMGAYDCCRASPTAVRSAEAAREISHREIGVLKVVRTGTLKVLKSRHNRDRPFGRMRGSDRAPPGGARTGPHQRIGNRSFASPVNNCITHREIAI
jgi:hypothetical protein